MPRSLFPAIRKGSPEIVGLVVVNGLELIGILSGCLIRFAVLAHNSRRAPAIASKFLD